MIFKYVLLVNYIVHSHSAIAVKAIFVDMNLALRHKILITCYWSTKWLLCAGMAAGKRISEYFKVSVNEIH